MPLRRWPRCETRRGPILPRLGPRGNEARTLSRTWTATDRGGNAASASQLVTVSDTPPRLAGVPDDAVVPCDAVPPPVSATASDNCDPSPRVTFAESRVDGDCPGTYVLRRAWTVTDRCGNTATATQVLRVVDTTPPVVEPGT